MCLENAAIEGPRDWARCRYRFKDLSAEKKLSLFRNHTETG